MSFKRFCGICESEMNESDVDYHVKIIRQPIGRGLSTDNVFSDVCQPCVNVICITIGTLKRSES